MTDPTHSGEHHRPADGPSPAGHPAASRAAAPHHPSLHPHASPLRRASRPPRGARNAGPIWTWVGAAAAAIAVIVWITLPPSRVALDDRCEPDGVAATLSAAVYGGTFWRSQQGALNDEILLLNGLPAADLRGREQQQTGAIERKMDRLSNQESSSDAAAQEKALAEEQHVRMERMALLVRCQGSVARRLGGAQ